MKKLLMLLCALTLFFGMAGVASAVSMTWTDIKDWSPDIYISAGSTYHYYHDISDDGFGGFGSGDFVKSYSLTVSLYDDEIYGGEKAYVDVFGWGAGSYDFSYTSMTFGWSFLGLLDLNHDGTLNVWIKSIEGDFKLDWSKLVAKGYSHDIAPVPEPATILLMGIGLLGLVGYGRKRFRQRS